MMRVAVVLVRMAVVLVLLLGMVLVRMAVVLVRMSVAMSVAVAVIVRMYVLDRTSRRRRLVDFPLHHDVDLRGLDAAAMNARQAQFRAQPQGSDRVFQ